MSDRKPPAKTAAPACGLRVRCTDDAARPRRRSGVIGGLLYALVAASLALATARKLAVASERKTHRSRGIRVEVLSNCSWMYGAPNGRAELFALPEDLKRNACHPK